MIEGLIASENIVNRAVLEAPDSVMTNKYAEVIRAIAIPGGCEWVGTSPRTLAIKACEKLFARSSPMCSRTPAAR